MKNQFKLLVLFSLFIVLIISCSEEFDLLNQNNFEVEDAQEWYNLNKPEEVGLKSQLVCLGKLNVKPDWENAYKGNTKNSKTIEVPLITQGTFGFATQESYEAFENTNDQRFKSSITRLVIKKDSESNETLGFLMTVIPDKNYREKKDYKAFSSYYKKWQKNFCGYIIYHHLNGNFANGWKIEEGEVTKTVVRNDNESIDIQLKSTKCHDVYIFDWYQDCTDWYKQNPYTGVYQYTNTTCSAPYEVGEYSHTECSEEIIDDHGSGGYNPTQNTCSCYECSVCGGCIVLPLKSTNISNCPPCSCPPVPPAAVLFLEEMDKINMNDPDLFKKVVCLMKDLAYSDRKLLTTEVFEGVGDSYNAGYDITEKTVNFDGHNIKIVVIYDYINALNQIGIRSEEHGSNIVFHEIFVRAKMNSAGEKPNLVLLRFEPQDTEFVNSVFKHIKGQVSLWECE